MKLIDADALISQISDDDEFDGVGIKYWISQEPTLDYEPVVHAHWEDDGSGHDDMICSHCGESPATDKDGWTFDALKNWGSEYCPNCGAKMDEEV